MRELIGVWTEVGFIINRLTDRHTGEQLSAAGISRYCFEECHRRRINLDKLIELSIVFRNIGMRL